jgi:hypothetical protein
MSSKASGDFARILDRDLGVLAEQIETYPDDAGVWRSGGSIKNSAGTLALHLVGNLEHFVGAVLGGTGYVRDREAEFGERDVPRGEILERIDNCRAVVAETLAALPDEALAMPYPGKTPPMLEGATTHLFLLHLAAHLAWHLGQIDYHRRLLA